MGKVLSVIFGAVCLAACVSQPKPEPVLSPAELARAPLSVKCEEAAKAANHPFATPFNQMRLFELMRNIGCFGPAQPQTIQIR